MGSHRVGHDWSDLAAAAAHLPKHHLHQNLEHGPIPQEVLSLPFPIYLPKTMSLFWLLSMKVSSTYASAGAMLLQSCPSLCDPIDGSPPGSPVPGILQAKTLERVAIAFSNAWKWKVKVKSLSCVPMATPWTAAYQAPLSMGFSRQEYWSGVPLPSPSTYARKEQKQNLTEYTFWCLDSFV